MQPSQKLPRDIQRGLTTILVRSALGEHANEPYAVITTSPSQWVPYCSSDSVILIDITALIGPSSWSTDQDLRDGVANQIRSAGWPDQQIEFEYRSSALQRNANLVRLLSVADVVVLGEDKLPIAVGELKRTDLSPQAIETAKVLAKGLSARFAFISNGDRFLFLDSKDQTVREFESFPPPKELGSSQSMIPEMAPGRSKIEIIRCVTGEEFLNAVAGTKRHAIILDYTLPFGFINAPVMEEIRHLMPMEYYPLRNLDVLTSLFLAIGRHASTERIAAFVPSTFLSGSHLASVRGYLQTQRQLAGVIELPPGSLAPAMMIAPAIVVLGHPRSNKQVVFLTVGTRGELIDPASQTWFQSFLAGVKDEAMASGFTADVRLGDSWSGISRRPEVLAAETLLNEVFAAEPLSKSFDVIQGSSHSREEDPKGIRIIRARDLTLDQIGIESLTKFKNDRPIPERSRVRIGDVLLQRIGTRSQCLLAEPELEGTAVGDSVIILRPNTDRAQPALLTQFLRSTIGQELLVSRAQTATAPALRVSALRTLPIPVLTSTISDDLDELQLIEQDLRARAEKLASMRLGLFNAETPENLSNRLREIRQSALAIEASIQQAETSEFQIRNFYPFPLAYPFRNVSTPTVVQERYKEQLRIAENTLAFLGSMSLALIEPVNRDVLVDTLKQAWQGGASPGHWREIGQRTAKVLTTYETNKLDIALGMLWATKRRNPFPELIEQLIQAKNDFKHDRGPKIDEDYMLAAEQVGGFLTSVMRELSFLTEYPIRLVTDIDGVRGSRRVVVLTRKYSGDHPVLPQEKLEYPETLTKGDLYVQIQDGNWRSLFPFISVHNCPQCKYQETYFIDRWNRADGQAVLKSFERGHIIEDSEIAITLLKWIAASQA